MTILALVLLLTRVTPASIPCPDLSGRYIIQGEDGRVYVTIDQQRCESLTIRWESLLFRAETQAKHTLPLDGRFRPDSEWFGGIEKHRTAATYRDDVLEIAAKPRAAGLADSVVWTLRLRPQPYGDLCTAFTGGAAPVQPGTRAARSHSALRAAEDSAARRSEKRC